MSLNSVTKTDSQTPHHWAVRKPDVMRDRLREALVQIQTQGGFLWEAGLG